MSQQVTVTPLADITSIMTGTTATWAWEVETVYVAGVSTAFTWTDGALSIPSYTSGTVLVEFTLYLLYDLPSQFLPSDPTNPASPVVYWENRLSAFISYATSIRSFETGLTDISIGNVSIQIDDDWLPLIQQVLIWSNRVIRIYRDGVITFKGVSTQSNVNGYVIRINVQKRITILDSECTWGDPDYLNRIDRSSSNAYYTGSNIPEEYAGFAIPMVFGNQTPYEIQKDSDVDLGEANPGLLVLPASSRRPARSLNTSAVCLRVIPTSATSGILGRMPNFQSISSVPISVTMTGRGAFTFSKAAQANNAVITSKMIPGEVAVMDRTTPGAIAGVRYYNFTGTTGNFLLGVDEPAPLSWALYNVLKNCDENWHAFPSEIPRETWTGLTILSGTFTPGGHRLLTVSGVTGIDLTKTELYVVITSVSGAVKAAEVLQFALESHGFTVDAASFAQRTIDFPFTTFQQAGFGQRVPTLGEFISEINRSLMMVLVFPASNDEPYLIYVNPNQAATAVIVESQISGLSWTSEYRDQAKKVLFKPKYNLSDAAKSYLWADRTASRSALLGSEKTIEILHVLDNYPDRFEEVTEIYGSPTTVVSFTLLDDEVTLELADMVIVVHPQFQNKILITKIDFLPIGRAIQGRYLYVN